MSGLLARLARHSALYGAATLLSKAIVLLMLPIYALKLSPSEFGVYSLLIVTAGILSGILSTGFGTGIIRQAVMNPDRDPRTYFVSGLVWFAGVTVFLAPVTLLFAPQMAGVLLHDAARGTWIGLTVTMGLLAAVGLAPGSYLRFRERPVAYSAVKVTQAMLLAILNIIVLLVLDWGIGGLLLSEVVAAAAALALGLYLARDGFGPSPERRAVRELLRYGAPLIPATLSMTALHGADRYFLNAYGFATDLGLYSMAYRFGFVLYLIVGAMQTAWPPIMYAAANEPDAPKRFATIYTQLISFFLWVGLAIALFSPPTIALLMPESYWGGSTVIAWVALAYVLDGVYAVVGNALYQSGKTAVLAYGLVLATALHLGLNAIVIPTHGMMGAAVSTVVAFAVLAVITGVAAQRVFAVPYEWARLAKLGAGAVASFALCRAIGGELGGVRVWLGSAAGVLAYPLLLIGLRTFTAAEWRSLRRSVPRLGRVRSLRAERGTLQNS